MPNRHGQREVTNLTAEFAEIAEEEKKDHGIAHGKEFEQGSHLHLENVFYSHLSCLLHKLRISTDRHTPKYDRELIGSWAN